MSMQAIATRHSGHPWLGTIPADWEVTPLKFVAEVFPSNVDKHSRDGEVPVSLCNYTDVYYNDVISADFDFMRATATVEQIDKFRLRSGDTIITKDSESADDIGLSAYVPDDLEGVVCGYHLSMIRPRNRLVGRYVKRLFDSHYVKAVLEVSANGLTRVGLGQYALDNIDIPLPPVSVQEMICDFLDHEIANIDALISKQEQLIATLREDRAATITQAVTKGLDPNVEMKDCGSGFPAIPAHWQVQPLKRLGRLITGGTPATGSEGNYASSGEGFPWFRPEDLDITGHPSAASKFISDSGLASVPRLSAPSVHVVSIGATLGKVGYVDVDSSSNQQITAVVGADCPRYTYFALVASYERIWASSMGNTLPIISAGRLGTVRLPVPPTNEQASIADYLDTRCARIDALIAKSMEMIETLREYRSALITDAVTGKIDVRGVA